MFTYYELFFVYTLEIDEVVTEFVSRKCHLHNLINTLL